MASSPPQSHGLSRPIAFALLTGILCTFSSWSRRWTVSGAPLFQVLVLLGRARGNQVLPLLHFWPLFTAFNLTYAVCSTSWLLYWTFTAACYPAIFLVCLVSFDVVSNFVRRSLRALLKELQFIDDRIAFFNIPALEIDTEVDGLMVLRGITFQLSTLSFVVHGVEVGIKLSDDMELAIQCEEVTIKLFRGIVVGDCFANLKGGEFEMTFGKVKAKSHDADGDAVFIENTPLLRAATMEADRRSLAESDTSSIKSPVEPKFFFNEEEEGKTVKMTEEMTNNHAPEDSSPKESLSLIKKMSPDNEEASGKYKRTVEFIQQTNAIYEARQHIQGLNKEAIKRDQNSFGHDDLNGLRAAVCSYVHSTPSVPHPPQKSIKVTTLQNLMPPWLRRFLHRLPLLYRLLLNPISYFHPVKIESITATASGKWIRYMLVENVLKDYSGSDDEIKGLKKKFAQWLIDANFAVQLGNITGIAQVPIISSYDIVTMLGFEDVMAYRTIPETVELKQVLRLGGADARFVIPSFLLPHHDHLLPPLPTAEIKQELQAKVATADGKPKELQATHELEQALKDEANVQISVHARLPACFDQQLLDFIAALVKATKIVEFDKVAAEETGDEEDDEERKRGIKELGRAFTGSMKRTVKKAVVGGVVNDRWIARLVGKVTKTLESAQGEAGYTGGIPVKLEVYRTGEVVREGDKILP
ncbi:hypothetical protein GLAREA_06295 [Glarea lozoyensis ATCC 20868]|uniref:Uncharacterized protein n=1 Tax=Glarea lozoyensis (strain ATCC 20868 / MF5171) TaxID=1116229 RepID=S3E4G4_GLAL2|nr:uncharacterized protein GLAREA_06295 [Glarea lozoyensis ATCC 20868]EPE33283.1 hypothetical protein GLAREA_06295 [Glarea lozoyensis ATCC 20868]